MGQIINGNHSADLTICICSGICQLQHALFSGIAKHTILSRSCRPQKLWQPSVRIAERRCNLRGRFSYPVAEIHRSSADCTQQAVAQTILMTCPEHIPVAYIQLTLIGCIVCILQQMLCKSILPFRDKIIAVSCNRCLGTGKHVFCRHSHTVNHCTVKVRCCAFQCSVHSPRRCHQRKIIFKIIMHSALSVHLGKADAFPLQIFIPVPIKAVAFGCIRPRDQLSGRILI